MSNISTSLHSYGLIGYPLVHSLSQELYERYSELRHITPYILHPITSLELFERDVLPHSPLGVNITSPYKTEILSRYREQIIPSPIVQSLGASNCLALYYEEGQWTKAYAYNTDVYGFRESLRPLISAQHSHALILGTGGASRAVGYALEELGIKYSKATRQTSHSQERIYNYSDLDGLAGEIDIVVNATSNRDIKVPSQLFKHKPLCYDLHYVHGQFLQEAARHNCPRTNGLEMLRLQAELSWQIWAKHRDLQIQEYRMNFERLTSGDELAKLDSK